MQKEIAARVKTTFTKPVMKCQGVLTYIKATSVVTWKMILQRPVMSFRQDGIDSKWQGEDKQEVFWSSDDPKDSESKVKFYVHPALYHGDAMMVKGRVVVEKC